MAIDGKTLCGSGNQMEGKPAIQMVSAWCSEYGLVLEAREDSRQK